MSSIKGRTCKIEAKCKLTREVKEHTLQQQAAVRSSTKARALAFVTATALSCSCVCRVHQEIHSIMIAQLWCQIKKTNTCRRNPSELSANTIPDVNLRA